jgi:hypothetical protein
MAVNGNICQTAFSDTGRYVGRITLTELKAAVQSLYNLKGNVQNCNCSPSNCCQTCQSTKCQSCQTTGCQSCQSCQYCQSYICCN